MKKSDIKNSGDLFLYKAILTYKKVDIEKTHDIKKLITLCNQNKILLIDDVDLLIDLTDYAVEGRYDMICDDLEDASKYIVLIESLLDLVKGYKK